MASAVVSAMRSMPLRSVRPPYRRFARSVRPVRSRSAGVARAGFEGSHRAILPVRVRRHSRLPPSGDASAQPIDFASMVFAGRAKARLKSLDRVDCCMASLLGAVHARRQRFARGSRTVEQRLTSSARCSIWTRRCSLASMAAGRSSDWRWRSPGSVRADRIGSSPASPVPSRPVRLSASAKAQKFVGQFGTNFTPLLSDVSRPFQRHNTVTQFVALGGQQGELLGLPAGGDHLSSTAGRSSGVHVRCPVHHPLPIRCLLREQLVALGDLRVEPLGLAAVVSTAIASPDRPVVIQAISAAIGETFPSHRSGPPCVGVSFSFADLVRGI